MSTPRADPMRLPGRLQGALEGRAPWLLIALVGGVFGAAILFHGGLAFPLEKDERHFWEQTLRFSDAWPPGVQDLRDYPEPMTPLSFLLWGAVEAAFGLGIAGGRALNLLLSLVVLVAVGFPGHERRRRGLLCACGLLLFPYYLPLSLRLYTDLPAAFFVFSGFWFHVRGRPGWSGLCFTLAVATRQYMVIFPLALAIAEVVPTLGWRPAWRPRRVLPLLGAVGSLLAWIAFFGGMGPASGLREWPRHMASLLNLTPAWGLYSLTCIGAYFVIPELVLFRRPEALAALRTRRSLGLALAIASCVLLFPPLAQGATMGALNRVLLLVLPPELLGDLSATIRHLVFGVLAWLACVRFARVDLIFWLLLLNFLLMSTTFQAWEKYNLSMLVTLWFLRSIHDLDHPLEVWQATRRPAQGEPHLGVG